MGQKKAAQYRIVVADARSPRDGRCIEEIGTYDPNTEPSTVKVNEERERNNKENLKKAKALVEAGTAKEIVAKIMEVNVALL